MSPGIGTSGGDDLPEARSKPKNKLCYTENMLTIIRKSELGERKVADNKFVLDYVTKSTTPGVSFVVIEGTDYVGESTISGNRIYFVLAGTLTMDVDGEKSILHPEDACFIPAGTKYQYVMSGSFKIITIDQPAHD